MPSRESHIERLIREATERGEFDNLPGAGRPLALGNPDDPDWWIKAKMRAEGLDVGAALPVVVSLRKEAAAYEQCISGSTPACIPTNTVCGASCQMICNQRCINPATDPANCGRCGAQCPTGKTCNGGACI